MGTSPNRLVLGFMLATAFLSMWISNTATAAMMLPIAIAVGEMFRPSDHEGTYEFGVALMLGVAYAASIGGIATLIGTPPNAILAGAANEILGVQIGFVQWMGVGVPVALVMLPTTWLLLTRVLYKPGNLSGDAARILDQQVAQLGAPSKGERVTGVVFALTALAWVFRSQKTFGSVTIPGLQTLVSPHRRLHDRDRGRRRALPDPGRLAQGRVRAGLADRPPHSVGRARPVRRRPVAGPCDGGSRASRPGSAAASRPSAPSPRSWSSRCVAALIVFLTEVTSNTATATMAMPIMAGAATGLGIAPLLPMAAAALAASMAFMLPVATPPNAIVFGSGYITIPQMSRAGFLLNLVAIATITVLGAILVPAFLL